MCGRVSGSVNSREAEYVAECLQLLKQPKSSAISCSQNVSDRIPSLLKLLSETVAKSMQSLSRSEILWQAVQNLSRV